MTDFHICDWAIICCCWLMILKFNMLFTLLFKSVIDVCVSRILLVSVVEPSLVLSIAVALHSSVVG